MLLADVNVDTHGVCKLVSNVHDVQQHQEVVRHPAQSRQAIEPVC